MTSADSESGRSEGGIRESRAGLKGEDRRCRPPGPGGARRTRRRDSCADGEPRWNEGYSYPSLGGSELREGGIGPQQRRCVRKNLLAAASPEMLNPDSQVRVTPPCHRGCSRSSQFPPRWHLARHGSVPHCRSRAPIQQRLHPAPRGRGPPGPTHLERRMRSPQNRTMDRRHDRHRSVRRRTDSPCLPVRAVRPGEGAARSSSPPPP